MDRALFEAMGQRGTELTGYPCMSVYHGFRYSENDVISGAFDDWVYNHQGVFAFTVEMWSIAKEAGLTVEDPAGFFFKGQRRDSETAQVLKWCDAHVADGFEPWREFEHPQLGSVQIGGWDRLYTWQNPPSEYLEAESEKNFHWLLALARSLPRLVIRQCDVQELEPGLSRVDLVVENQGYLPSCGSHHGRDACGSPSVRAQVALSESMELVAGDSELDLGHLTGIGDVIHGPFVDPVYFGGVTKTSVARAQWIVKGTGSMDVVVTGGRSGSLRQQVVLL